MDNKFGKNINKCVREDLCIMICIAFLESIISVILKSQLINKNKWKTVYRKIKKLECDIANLNTKESE